MCPMRDISIININDTGIDIGLFYRWVNKSLLGSKGKQSEAGEWESGALALEPASPSPYTACTNINFLELNFISMHYFIRGSTYKDEGKNE